MSGHEDCGVVHLNGPLAMARSGTVRQVVVLLHGLGADGNDLISLAPIWQEEMEDVAFIAPDAPFPCDMAPFGKQWFSLRDQRAEAMEEGVRQAAAILDHFLDELLANFGLEDRQMALVGFSQGTMTGLFTALRRQKPCAGVLGYSGALLHRSDVADEITARPPVCLIHGADDAVVPFQAMAAAKAGLESLGITPECHARPGLGHGIDQEGIEIGREFLKRVLCS